MRKICVFIAVALLLMSAMALAEDGMNVEVIRVDGVSVVVLTSEDSLRSESLRRLMGAELKADFVLPELLTVIEDSAFEGIAAENIEVTENVAAIGARAFADCASLATITIPATVVMIDDTAFEGCAGVTVFGAEGSEADRIAALYGFDFIDPNAEQEVPEISAGSFIPAAVVLPPAPLN